MYEKYLENLCDCNGITLPKVQHNVKSNFSYFPILVDESRFGMNRDEIYCRLKGLGINSRKYFYPLICEYECYKDRFNIGELKIAKRVSKQVLTLPLYADLKMNDVVYICDAIRKMR